MSRDVLFIAAENGALRGGKVGGVADVVRDLPAALGAHGWRATVVTPSYGALHTLPGAEQVATVVIRFAAATETLTLWQVPGQFPDVRYLVFDHALFAAHGVGEIYFGDEANRPYATDATKFAFFCAAVAEWLVGNDWIPDAVHLHDWHAAFYFLLRNYSPRHEKLRGIRTVFTIHNLAYQGTRPLRGDESSLATWFPGLEYDRDAVSDPQAEDCVNPMAMAIRLADKLSTVSPSYAHEICRPSDSDAGFVGGEGLEALLATAIDDDRLLGVLNGCYYDEPRCEADWPSLVATLRRQAADWAAQEPGNPAHALAVERIAELPETRPGSLLVSIGRLVAQKATLFTASAASGLTALDEIAATLSSQGWIIVLGSGEARYEQAILDIARRNSNILFLLGYSESLGAPLYANGDLFLMPSSFEPCGISQMLAMRAELPCVVHGVGGLRDTVSDGDTGFVFAGNDIPSQVAAFVTTTRRALALRREDPEAWRALCERAGEARFSWSDAARITIAELYGVNDD